MTQVLIVFGPDPDLADPTDTTHHSAVQRGVHLDLDHGDAVLVWRDGAGRIQFVTAGQWADIERADIDALLAKA